MKGWTVKKKSSCWKPKPGLVRSPRYNARLYYFTTRTPRESCCSTPTTDSSSRIRPLQTLRQPITRCTRRNIRRLAFLLTNHSTRIESFKTGSVKGLFQWENYNYTATTARFQNRLRFRTLGNGLSRLHESAPLCNVMFWGHDFNPHFPLEERININNYY